jgi:transcriptional regulator with XRE-family HTH domain
MRERVTMQGSDLKAIREHLGLSQDEMAERLGLSRVMVGLMERDQRPIERRTEQAALLIHVMVDLEAKRDRAIAELANIRAARLLGADGTTEATPALIALAERHVAEFEEVIAKGYRDYGIRTKPPKVPPG